MTNIVVGIDIGGTTTSFGFVDRRGRLLARETIPTQGHEPATVLVTRLRERIDDLRKTLPSKHLLKGIGIGAPNANYYRGTVENPVNLNWGAEVNLVKLFRQCYELPVAITNDAKAAAIGELLFGGARGMRHFIVITLGTGLGSGIVSDGKLVYGVDGFAGELGHTVVDPDGRQCACGKKGCLETYVSATGLCRTLSALLAKRLDHSRLRDVTNSELTSKMIFEEAVLGDVIALEAFDVTARILGMKLADAVAHTRPGAIFLFGGLAKAEELFLGATRRYMEEFLFPQYRGKVRLMPSALVEGSGAILGAGALIWHELSVHRGLNGGEGSVNP